MNLTGEMFEIQQARLTIRDRQEFLQFIRSVSRNYGTPIICFNADSMAGRGHVEAALKSACRSFFSDRPISNSIEMEALLFAAGSRQCSATTPFGIHDGENAIFVCLWPRDTDIWEDLVEVMTLVNEDWNGITREKEERLRLLFGITREELRLVMPAGIEDLILERVALLEVNR